MAFLSSPVVMILRGLPDGGTTPWDGQYLRDFDFEAFEGRGNLDATPDIEQAKQFTTTAEAFEFLMAVPKSRPEREDGRPNRPLTATTWEITHA